MGAFSEKGKVDLHFFNKNLDTHLYIEILEISLLSINKIIKKFSDILQFDNHSKHRSLKALEFYKENYIKIIYSLRNSPDLNQIKIFGRNKK